jgi:hypothetical protein
MPCLGWQLRIVWGGNYALFGVPTTPCSEPEYACLQGSCRIERAKTPPSSLFPLLFSRFQVRENRWETDILSVPASAPPPAKSVPTYMIAIRVPRPDPRRGYRRHKRRGSGSLFNIAIDRENGDFPSPPWLSGGKENVPFSRIDRRSGGFFASFFQPEEKRKCPPGTRTFPTGPSRATILLLQYTLFNTLL